MATFSFEIKSLFEEVFIFYENTKICNIKIEG